MRLKKYIALLLLATMTFSMSSCKKKDDDENEKGFSSNETIGSSSLEQEEKNPEGQVDTTTYRGVLVDATEMADGTFSAKLTEVDGINYGIGDLYVTIKSAEEVKKGGYYEVIIGNNVELESTQASPIKAMSVIYISEKPEKVIVNGVVSDISIENGIGSMLVKAHGTGEEFLFYISDYTKILMDTKELKKGAEISVYHSGTIIGKGPAQGDAYEINVFHKVPNSK